MADVGIRDILSRDISSYGREGSLFSQTPDQTIALIREWIEERDRFTRKSLTEHAQCTVCGLSRLSLLCAVPYGKLLVSSRLSEDEKKIMGLEDGAKARNPFSRRRMTLHRRIFNKEGKEK